MNTSKQTTTSQSQTGPWTPQAAALTGAFNDAQTAYNKASGAVAPTDFTAGMTPDQLSVFQSMLGTGGALSSAVGGNAGTGSGMVNSGANGAEGALTALLGADPSAINNLNASIKGGMAYAGGMDIPGAVRAAMQPAMEQARDVTLPGITVGAAGSGNINSNRPDLASGVVQRGLAENAQNIGSTMYNDAFKTGADLATGINTSNVNSGLGALTAALSGGTGLATGGSGVASGGVNDATNALALALGGATGPQTNNQLGLTNELQQYQSQVGAPFDALTQLMSIIGSNNWGSNSSGTQTTTSTPSAMSTIGSLMGAGGSLLGSKGGLLGGGSGLLGLLGFVPTGA